MGTKHKNEKDARERRQFSRIDFQRQLVLQGRGDKLYAGVFNEVSLKGMLFQAETLPAKGEEVFGPLVLGELEIRIGGKVIFSDPKRGAVIKFMDMDVESFSHLRRLVALNMGDSETIDREFFSAL